MCRSRRAAELMRAVPPFVTRVAVVGGDAHTILELVEAIEPHALQLHRDETEACVTELADRLAGANQLARRIDLAPDVPE